MLIRNVSNQKQSICSLWEYEPWKDYEVSETTWKRLLRNPNFEMVTVEELIIEPPVTEIVKKSKK